MPLVTCPDCGREVSTAATACPQCGRPMAAVAAPAPQQPPGKEETLWRGTPSWLLVFGKIVGAALVIIILPVILYFASNMLGALNTQIAWWIIVAIVLWLLISVVIALLRIKTTIYTVTNQRVTIETGLVTKSVEDIDLRYIDDTQFRQSFMERLVGIGNVSIISSDKTTPNYILRGIRDPRALRELIRTNAYQVSQRQLFTRAT